MEKGCGQEIFFGEKIYIFGRGGFSEGCPFISQICIKNFIEERQRLIYGQICRKSNFLPFRIAFL